MEPEQLQKELLSTTKEFNKLQDEYRQHIVRYAFSLVLAELTVVGFLLQNKTTNQLLSQHYARYVLLASLYASFLSIILSVVAKRFAVYYNKKLMHSYIYKAYSASSGVSLNIDGLPVSPLPDAENKSGKALRLSWRLTKYVRGIYIAAEVTLGIATLLGLLCVTIIMTKNL